MRGRKILIMGLPDAGKTTLARELAPLIGAVHFEADQVRANIGRDLGFTVEDRIEQARRMGWLCDRVTEAGYPAIADFICPTEATRDAFGDCYTVFVDRIAEGCYADTNTLFEPPSSPDFVVTAVGPADYWARAVAAAFDAPAVRGAAS